MVQQFVKKPVVIEAIQYTGNNDFEINQWSKGNVYVSPDIEETSYLQIQTLEGVMTAILGDWIIKGVKGEFYPCKPDIFEMTYQPV